MGWAINDEEKSREYNKLWRSKNKEKCRAYKLAAAEKLQKAKLEDPEKYEAWLIRNRISGKKWRDANPDKCKTKDDRRTLETRRKQALVQYYKDHEATLKRERIRKRKARNKLQRTYLSALLYQRGCKINDLSDEALKAFKLQIEIKREIKNQLENYATKENETVV